MKLDSILVALDSSGSMPLLRAAAELANQSNAELRAIYVEDKQWFEASKFSFTQQISSFTGELMPFDESRLKRESHALSSLLKKRFSDLGNSMKIKYSYQSVRGAIDKELMKAAGEVDLVMIGKTGHTFEQRKRLGSNARYLAEQCSVPVLIWNEGSSWPRQVIGICKDKESSSIAIEWSIYLSEQMSKDVRLLWPGEIEWDENWINQLDNVKGAWPNAQSRLEFISREKAELSFENLKKYRNALIVVQRNALLIEPGTFLENIPNSVCIL